MTLRAPIRGRRRAATFPSLVGALASGAVMPLLAAPATGHAGSVISWPGLVNNQWSEAGNRISLVVPAAGDTVLIDQGPVASVMLDVDLGDLLDVLSAWGPC